MAVEILSGDEFPGVKYGTASGREREKKGDDNDRSGMYIVGCTPVIEMLRVDKEWPASIIAVKYSHHELSDTLSEERGPDDDFRITMLVDGGPWHQRVWRQRPIRSAINQPGDNESITVLLMRPGDYIAWSPGLSHRWRPEGRTTMVTVSIRRWDTVERIDAQIASLKALRQKVAAEPNQGTG
jgi:hypothetical protein